MWTDGGVSRRAYQPVVVRRPLARDGRGFRGLCTPVAVAGISVEFASHVATPSLRGRVFATGMMDFAEVRRCGVQIPQIPGSSEDLS